MPSPNNPSPSAEFLSHAQNPSVHDSNFSNISGPVISVTVVNPPAPGYYQPLAQSSYDNQELQPPYGQVMKEYPAIHGPLAPGKSNNPFALNRNDLGVTTTDPPFTNSSNESSSDPSSFWGDGPLQHQISTELPNAMGSGSWSSTNSSLVSLIPDNESDFSPSETMSRCSNSDEIYVKAMLPLRRGYPLSAPQPISSLPVEKRRVGTIIGDVGTIRDDGSFDYLFNPLLPTTDPRNPDDLPTAFNDVLPPVARTSQVRSAFNSRTAVCSPGRHCNTNREKMELSISHTSDNGALLFLPDGASQEDLINSGEIKQFIIKNAEAWISYAINTGRDIDRNSLYFVTGCTKAGDWGMATFNPSMPWEESSLKLGQSTHPNDPRYIWERSFGCEMARTGPGPDEELDNERPVPQNQTLFIKGYKIAFSEDAWTRILAESHGTIAVNTGQSMNGSTSDTNAGSGPTSGGSQAPSIGNAIYNTSNCNKMSLEPIPAYDKLFHPLDTINRVLLREIPEAEMAIAHDDDWCELTNGYDPIDSELVVQLVRSKYSASYYEGAAVLSTTQDALSARDEIIDLDITADLASDPRAGNEGGRDTLESAPVLCDAHGLPKSIENADILHPSHTVVRQETPPKPETFHRPDHFVEYIARWLFQEKPFRVRIIGPAGVIPVVAFPLIKKRSLAKRFMRMFSGKDKGVLTEENASMAERFKNSFSRKSVEYILSYFVSAWDMVSPLALALNERRMKFLPEYDYGYSAQPPAKPLGQKPSIGNKRHSQDQRNLSNGNEDDAPAKDIPPCYVHGADNDDTANRLNIAKKPLEKSPQTLEPFLKSRNLVKRSHAIFDLPRHSRTLAPLTIYDEFAAAYAQEDFTLLHTRLQQEWTFYGGFLVGLIAINIAMLAITLDSILKLHYYACTAMAISCAACGLGIACDVWFLLRYGWVDLGTFIYRSRDVYYSYVFFSLSSRIPTFCTLISSISLMSFLGLIAYDARPLGVLVIGVLLFLATVLQFSMGGPHLCAMLALRIWTRGWWIVMVKGKPRVQKTVPSSLPHKTPTPGRGGGFGG